MRVIAGRLGGRSFTSPRGHRTHPMSDKVRGALFNTLGDIGNLTLLDAFAGSGAIGYESISRGAALVTLIESDRSAQQAISENIKTLGIAATTKLIKSRLQAWLATSSDCFDIVVADPPYDNLQMSVLLELAERVNLHGLLVLSLPPATNIALPASCQLLSHKNYGDAELLFYRRVT